MKLSELDPCWLRTDPQNSYIDRNAAAKADAQGILFKCPVCYAANGNSIVGVHSIMCWQPSVPQAEGRVGPGRWEMPGTSFDDVSFVAGSSSVLVHGGCNAHFFVRNGEIILC